MKTIIWLVIIIVLVVFLGTWPLSIFQIVFNAIGTAFGWLAGILNFFGWNGFL